VVINHAVSGAWITTQAGGSDMDEQTVAAENDNADVIFILLGTNGDTYVIQAEYEENLEELKTSNPNAVIYGIGILPRADPTDNGRSTKNPLIEAACSSAGVTYWNTDGWIDPATDTTDGLHPTEAGQIKIANEILARLP
jgi:lysophospholipase L1-like esterase